MLLITFLIYFTVDQTHNLQPFESFGNSHMGRSTLFLFTALTVVLSSLAQAAEVNIYSARKEALIKPLLDEFSAKTGIEVNLVTGKADALLSRLQSEGRNTPADVFITVDAGRLHRAKEAGVLQTISDPQIEAAVPANLRDADGQWIGLSQRARVIFYAKDRVDPSELSTYEALADPKWKGRICIRSSNNIYNQSLVASLIAAHGEEEVEEWARGLVANMARPPRGGDRDQIKAVAAGECDLAVANTYYYGKMLTGDDAGQKAAAEQVALFWPNQNGRGAHVNVSGAGVTRHAKNPDAAIELLRFLVSPEAQSWYAEVNFEYPVREGVEESELLASWGDFKADNLNLSTLGEYNAAAVMLMDRAGWR
jgi:iron(III) transport system substrate-binding protein